MKKLLIGFLLLGILLPAATRTDQFNLSYWLYKPAAATDLTPYWKIDGTSTPNASWNLNAFNLTASNLTASPTLGAELITGATAMSTWTDVADWSYGSSKWTHAATGATALVTNWSPTATVQYKIIVTITHTSGTGVVVSCGGQTYASVATTSTFYLTAIATTALTFTPSTNWIGDITAVSVMAETNGVLTATTGIFTNGMTLSSGAILLPNGTAAIPSLAFANSFSSGIYYDLYAESYPRISIVTNGQIRAQFWAGRFDVLNNIINFGNVTIDGSVLSTLQLGGDAATPANYVIKGPNGLGVDKPGGMFTIQGGASTGTNDGGGVCVQTSTKSTTSSTPNTEYTRYRAVGKIVTLTDASATDVVSFAVTAGNSVGGMLVYTINVYDNDASDNQVESGTVLFSGLQDEANWHTNISEVSVPSLESGTLTTTWAIDTATANTLKITCLADSDLTTPVITLRYQLFLNSPIVETIN